MIFAYCLHVICMGFHRLALIYEPFWWETETGELGPGATSGIWVDTIASHLPVP